MRGPGFIRSIVDMLDILLGIWQIGNMSIEAALRALASDKRLQILEWLKEPRTHFPPQVEGDLVKDGVCGVFIAEKLGVSQPTASEHLKVLAQAGLIRGKRIKQWTFYKREEARISELKRAISKSI
jgi:ArsR family transcriptional regulator